MKIDIQCTKRDIPEFFSLTRQGIGLDIPGGQSVQDILVKTCELDEAYVIERIMTIFLDGKPVDNPLLTAPSPGSVIGLAAAMPGLIGVCMGKGSPLGNLRGEITTKNGLGNAEPGRITLKLFNLVATEQGPHFLQRGVYVPAPALAALLAKEQEFTTPPRCWVNKEEISQGDLVKRLQMADEAVFLTVKAE